MREIARVADVGFGTVSAYASDKAGLAAMLFVEDIDDLEPVFTKIHPGVPLLDQVIDQFALIFRFWANKPDLSRVVLPMLGNTDGPYIELIMRRRAKIRQSLIAFNSSELGKLRTRSRSGYPSTCSIKWPTTRFAFSHFAEPMTSPFPSPLG